MQSLMSGEEGRGVVVGRSKAKKPLNRFKNIYPCKFISLYPATVLSIGINKCTMAIL